MIIEKRAPKPYSNYSGPYSRRRATAARGFRDLPERISKTVSVDLSGVLQGSFRVSDSRRLF